MIRDVSTVIVAIMSVFVFCLVCCICCICYIPWIVFCSIQHAYREHKTRRALSRDIELLMRQQHDDYGHEQANTW
jgi:hypothetical protein